MNSTYKLYCVFSRESLKRMNGIRGKMTSQAGHAFLHSFWDADKRFPFDADAYRKSQKSYKITLVVDTDEELLSLYEKYKNTCGATKVIDAGLTVFKEPNLTCVGLGPLNPETMGQDFKDPKTLA